MIPRPIVLALLVALVASCGARTKMLRTGLVSLNAARDTTLVVNKAREALIVEQATTKEEAIAKVAAWRVTVDAVFVALDVAYRAVHDAWILNDSKSASDAGAKVAKALALARGLPR